jgi:sulfotransferase family protein
MYQAIQFIGTQRSGSNLLRVMLDQFPEVFGPHPPHVLVTFYPLLKYYGDLEETENFKKLIEDICHLIELNPVPWDGSYLDREKIFKRCRRHTLLEVFIQINEFECQESGKKIWCCKSMESLYLLDKFREEGFEPLYLYLYRDGRDVALSFKKAIVGEKHIYNLAVKWKADQDTCLQELEKLDPERYIKIKYEDYIADSDVYIKEICKRTGIVYRNVANDFYKSEESKRTAAGGKMWENVTKPVMKNNYGKFLKELSTEEILIFEQVAGDTLVKLGYQLHALKPGENKPFTAEMITAFNAENNRLKKQIVNELPPEDIRKRKLQSDLIEQIKGYKH